MKVSFVLPIFKKTLSQVKKSITSLLDQSHTDIEIVCVFDGPDPIVESYVDKLVEEGKVKKVLIEHGGAPKARNEGFKHTTGDAVAFWDCDCYAEPEMTKMWVMTFKDNPDCDFVYSGYKWVDPNVQGFDSESFDAWKLNKYNYIASMFPLKRDKVVAWDEELTGLQDWDYWRRVVAQGCKGKFIPGYGFSTDLPDKNSISGNTAVTTERIAKIRAKHGDQDKDILIHGVIYKYDTVRMAKILDADYFWNPFWKVRDYKMVMMVGFHAQDMEQGSSLFRDSKPGTLRAIYWMGLDAESLFYGPYSETKRMAKAVNESITNNFCPDSRTQSILEEMGIKADILIPPRGEGVPATELPKTFKVLAYADNAHAGMVEGVRAAMPDVHFDFVVSDKPYNTLDYVVGLQFTVNHRLETGSKNLLMQGRHLISNVKEPYAGYVDTAREPLEVRKEIIGKIRAIQADAKFNTDGQEYYLGVTDPEKFRGEVLKLLAPKLEVVA